MASTVRSSKRTKVADGILNEQDPETRVDVAPVSPSDSDDSGDDAETVIDPIHEGVTRLFEDYSDEQPRQRLAADPCRMNVLHSTATDSDLPKPGNEYSLLRNLVGVRSTGQQLPGVRVSFTTGMSEKELLGGKGVEQFV